MRIRQSICYPIIVSGETPFDELCRTAAEIGYAAIEMWQRPDDFERVAATAQAHGLVVASMSGHASLEDGLNKVENHDRIEQELIESIDVAAKHGVPGLICFSGNRNHGQSDLEGMIACAQGLRRAVPHAEKKEINLNVELLNSKVDHPHYQCDRTDWGVALCEMVGSPRAKLLFDIYHMQIMEGDVIRTIRKAVPHIGHFHTAGNPDRRDPDDTQELNYAGICRAIADTSFDLYVGHEYAPRGDRVASLKKTFQTCDQG